MLLRSCSSARLLLLSRRSPFSPIRTRSGHLRPGRKQEQRGTSSCSSSSSSLPSTRTTTTTMALGTSADPAAAPADPTPTPPASSAAAVRGLDPPLLWQHFLTLSALPRPSKREEAVVNWLRNFVEERKGRPGPALELREDAAGNVLIFRPGSGGGEDAEIVCVQGHIDMVTEKDAGVEHDFDRDPLLLRRSDCGHWITATGTTLGADNGIGVCAALALLDSPADAKLPPLECLFTVDEETGLSGAFGLDGTMVKAVRLVNLDTEDWGDLFIGCAGGGDTQVVLPARAAAESSPPLPAEDAAAGTRLRLGVRGLLGGHSGINIGDDRGNAVILAARLADAAAAASAAAAAAAAAAAQAQAPAPSFLVATARGGDKRNALAREASVDAWVPHPPGSEAASAVLEAARAEAEAIREEYGTLEKDIEVVVEAVAPAADDGADGSDLPPLLDAKTSDALLTLLLTLPHGVIKKSHTVEGLVETSTNLASVAPVYSGAGDDGKDEKGPSTKSGAKISAFRISCSTRSSLMPALEATRRSIARVARGAGAGVEQGEAYPGWAADPDAPLVALARESVEGVTGRPALVGAIHAGLECGLIKAIVGPRMRDAVSFGPTILGAHSPEERVDVRTVGPFFEAVKRLMERLADEKKEK